MQWSKAKDNNWLLTSPKDMKDRRYYNLILFRHEYDHSTPAEEWSYRAQWVYRIDRGMVSARRVRCKNKYKSGACIDSNSVLSREQQARFSKTRNKKRFISQFQSLKLRFRKRLVECTELNWIQDVDESYENCFDYLLWHLLEAFQRAVLISHFGWCANSLVSPDRLQEPAFLPKLGLKLSQFELLIHKQSYQTV